METQVDDEAEMARAKESLMARMDELGKRFQSAKHKLDIEAHIADHPMVAAGIALAAGLLLGAHGSRRIVIVKDEAGGEHVVGPNHPATQRRSLAGAAKGIVMTLVMGAVKDLVLDHAKTYAKAWLGADEPTPAGDLSSEKVGSDM